MKRILIASLFLITGCRQQIQHGLDESQANTVETVLIETGIDARKVKEGGRDGKWAIEVPEEAAASAVKVLADQGLPGKSAPGFEQVFGKGSMVPTKTEELALFTLALSGELSQMLTAIPGVVHARVLPVAPTTNTNFGPAPKKKAGVVLTVRNGQRKDIEARKAELQALVASSIENLDAADVSIVVAELPPAPETVPTRSPEVFRIVAVAGALLVSALAIALVLAVLKARRLRLELATPRPAAPARPATRMAA